MSQLAAKAAVMLLRERIDHLKWCCDPNKYEEGTHHPACQVGKALDYLEGLYGISEDGGT